MRQRLYSSIWGGIVIFAALGLASTIAYQFSNAGRIFPGIRVAGVDVSGLSPGEAAIRLSRQLPYPAHGKIIFSALGQAWTATPEQLGMVFDASQTARAAYAVGREGGPISAFTDQIRSRFFGVELAPVVLFDQRVAYKFVQDLSRYIDIPVVEPGLRYENGALLFDQAQGGRSVDVDAAVAGVSLQLMRFQDGEVALQVRETSPTLQDLSGQAELVRRLVSEPLVLALPAGSDGDLGPWTYDPEIVARLIGLAPVDLAGQKHLQVTVDSAGLRRLLLEIAPVVDKPAMNARFHFSESSKQLVLLSPSRSGRILDLDASLQVVTAGILAGEHRVELLLKYDEPAAPDTATAATLGISRLLPNGSYTSYFRGSHEERMQNIQAASARLDGALVAPGAIFSMGETLGDISLESGFAEALIIYGGKTIKGVGGGVCQVSTTLFRTIFFAGFPVVERVPHAYRVSYYEQTARGVDGSYAGMDATVYFPLVDFKFRNDSPNWILIETFYSADTQSLTVKLYSTPDGRSVQWSTTGPTEIVAAPKPLFQPNPDLQAGGMRQTDWAANGARVDLTRTVVKDAVEYFTDEFKTQYEPWQAVCEYAPGMSDPAAVAKRRGLCLAP